jgi:hypothetical protein
MKKSKQQHRRTTIPKTTKTPKTMQLKNHKLNEMQLKV